MKTYVAVLLAMAAGLVLVGMAQDERDDPAEIRFETPAEGIGLRAFVDWLGRHLPGPITFAPPALDRTGDAAARVVIEKPVRLAAGDVLGFGQDVLAPFGLVLFELGPPERPLWLLESLEAPTVLKRRTIFVAPEDLGAHRLSPIPITTLLRLEHRALRDVLAEIERAVGADRVIAVAPINGLILQDKGTNVHAAVELIRRLDRSPPAAEPARDERLDRLEARIEALEQKAGR